MTEKSVSLEATYINFTALGLMLSDFAEDEADQELADELVFKGEWRKEADDAH
jgi:hypothetical protein